MVCTIRLLLARKHLPSALQWVFLLLHGPTCPRHARQYTVLNPLSWRFLNFHSITSSATDPLVTPGGIFASIASLTWRSLKGGKPTDSSHGASGSYLLSVFRFPRRSQAPATSRNLRHNFLLCMCPAPHNIPYLRRHTLPGLGVGGWDIPFRRVFCIS
jgi:hypothetical protein